MEKLDLLLEAERRGILPADKVELLTEARNRGLIPALEQASSVEGMQSPKRFDYASSTLEERRAIRNKQLAEGSSAVNLAAGALRGAGSIGATALRPFESAEENEQRRLAMDLALQAAADVIRRRGKQ